MAYSAPRELLLPTKDVIPVHEAGQVYRGQDRRLKLKRQSRYRDMINVTDGVGVEAFEMSSFSRFSFTLEGC